MLLICAAVWASAQNPNGVGRLDATIQSGNVAEVAQEMLKSRWENPVVPACPISLPPVLGKYKGKNVAILFFTMEKENDAVVAEPALELAQKLASEAKAGNWKLEVVIVTPATPDEIKPYLKVKGISLPVVHDGKDDIRRAMTLYGAPLLLIDSSGNLIWKMRMGNRKAAPFDPGDLFVAAQKLGKGNYKIEPNPITTAAKAGEKIFDFEAGADGWTLKGDAWGPEGSCSEKYYPGLVKGFLGRRWLSSFTANANRGTGLAISPEFTISKRYLHLLVGGGDLPQYAGIALVCNGVAIKVATGTDSYELSPIMWDLAAWRGKPAKLVVYDCGTSESRDGIMVDGVTASDSATTPPTFADRHDPNNPAHANRVAADLPEEWKALQTGNFHMSVNPGKTFKATCTKKGTTNPEENGVVVYNEPFPNTINQKIWQDTTQLSSGGRSATSKGIAAGLDIVELGTKNKSFTMERTIVGTANTLTLERGPGKNYVPIPEKTRRELKNRVWDGKDGQAYIQYRKKEGLDRWAGEKDCAYVLRVWRWMQRTWTDYGIWKGWPVQHPDAGVGIQELEKRCSSCPAVGGITDMCESQGIPATFGQGFWGEDNGNECTPHMRGLIFLENIGWILIDDDKNVGSSFGQFTFGHSSGDNFLMNISPEIFGAGGPRPKSYYNQGILSWEETGGAWTSIKTDPPKTTGAASSGTAFETKQKTGTQKSAWSNMR